MKVKTVPIESIIPNEKNVRLHGHAQLEALKQSYLMFGQFRPIVIDENNIILAGHGIWEAMIAAGAKECSVYQYDNLSNAQKLKLMLADNKTQELGTFNFDKFDEVIKEISLDGDLNIPGYDSDVLDMIVKQQNMDTGALDEKITDYGKFSEERITEIKDKAEVSASKGDSSNENKEVFLNPDKIHMTTPEGGSSERPRPYAICKKCGEKVWL